MVEKVFSGDDPTAIQLTAKLDGDHYILNGTKLFVLGYDETQLYVVTARHENKTGANGIFCIAVRRAICLKKFFLHFIFISIFVSTNPAEFLCGGC